MYEIRHAGAKGLGVFASKQISRGIRIFAEQPVLTVQSERDVHKAVNSLTEIDREGLMRLSVSPIKRSSLLRQAEAAWHVARSTLSSSSQKRQDSTITEYMALLAIFRNNNFDIGNGVQAVFGDICRINHSCLPNTQGNFNSTIGRFTIHAVRSIEPDEELTISYLDEHGAARDLRQSRLLQSYGFACDCPACDLSTTGGREGEERRLQLQDQLRAYVERAAIHEEVDHQAELWLTQDLIKVFEGDGLAGRELATMYFAAAELNMKIGDRQEAQRCSRRGLDIDESCLGTDNPLYRESSQRAEAVSCRK